MPPVISAALVVASAALMLAAGHTLAGAGWTSARPLGIGGGLTIQLALFLERRGVRRRANRTRHGRAWAFQLCASALIAASGVGLAFIGHSAATGGWWPVGVAAAAPLIAVVAAAPLNRAAAEIRRTRATLRAGPFV